MSKANVRFLGLAPAILLAACSAASPPVPADPNAYEVDAKGAPAVIDQTLTLDSLGQPIGVVTGVARCGDLLMFGDSMGQVRRMNLSTGKTLPSIAKDASTAAMTADCQTRSLYLLGDSRPRGRRGRRQVQTFNIDTGAPGRTYPIDLMMIPDWNATLSDGAFVVGGTWMPIPVNGQYQHPPAPVFYSDKKLGFKVSLSSGEGMPLFQPYDMSCRARCPFSTLTPVVGHAPLAWVATQTSSKDIAFYDATGTVQQRFDITSPLFVDEGSVVRTLGGEADVRWSVRNSLVELADQFGDAVATVHYRTRLPADYTFGQSTEFDYWVNLHSLDGHKLVSDIKLPGMPVGRDDTHVYVTDYGPDGRHSAPGRLKILRIPVRAGTEGFVHRAQDAGRLP